MIFKCVLNIVLNNVCDTFMIMYLIFRPDNGATFDPDPLQIRAKLMSLDYIL